MKTFCLSLFFIMIICHLQGQALEIEKGSNIKSFTKGNLLEVRYIGEHKSPTCDYCSYNLVSGNYISQTSDSISFEVLTFFERREMGDSLFVDRRSYKKGFNYMSVPKNQVFLITDINSPQKNKNRKVRGGFGIVFIFTGIATGITSYLTSQKEHKWRNALSIGGSQLLLGTVLTISSKERKYYLIEDSNDPWKFKSK